MIIDQLTLSLATAVVVIVAGLAYLLETLMRKDGAPGRLWAVAFLAGILTVLGYLIWAIEPGAFVAVAVGNAAFVASAGFMWLGCLAFNARRLRVPGAIVAALVLLAFVSVLAAGPEGGDWAGAVPFFLGTAAGAILASVESRRGAMGRRWSAIGLTVLLGVEGLWFAARAVAFVVFGAESAVFRDFFGTAASSFITIVLTVVAVVVTSVLRASESHLRGQRDVYSLRIATDGIMLPASFQSAVSTMLERAQRAGDVMCLVAVRIDDLPQITNAFGPEEGEKVAATWRSGVRAYAPTASMVGETASQGLQIAFVTTSFADVRRMASILHRRLLDDLATAGVSAMPVVGMGIAVTDQLGYDFAALSRGADEAAKRSESSPDASVMIAEG